MNNQTIEIKGLLPPPSYEFECTVPPRSKKKPHIIKILTVSIALIGAAVVAATVAVISADVISAGSKSIPALFFPASDAGIREYLTLDGSETDTDDIPVYVPPESEEPVDIYAYDSSSVPEGCNGIVPYDMSTTFLTDRPYLSNATNYTPDIEALKNAEYPLKPVSKLAAAGEPTVLIIHTHGTEAYSKEGMSYYSDTENLPRSNDISKNVVAVGAAMTEQLLKRGISTLHCTVMHDEQSYKDSYSRSAETIEKYLSEYPSIKYVFDVHRDSIIRSDGDKIRPVSLCDGETVAEVMSVVGTDELGADYPEWKKT